MIPFRIAALGGAWVAVAGGLLVWVVLIFFSQLREQLKIAQFWSLEACVAFVLILAVLVARELRSSFVSFCDRFQMLAFVALVACFTLGVAFCTNRIYYDEQIYQSIGQNLSDLKLAQMCNSGVVEYGCFECSMGEYNKQLYAYFHLLSVAYRLFGVREATVFVVNALVMVVFVFAVYLLIWILFEDRVAAWFAALIMVLMPQQIVWLVTAVVEPTASLVCVMVLLCVVFFARSRSTVALAVTVCSAVYVIQFRFESVLLLLVAVALVFRTVRMELGSSRLWWFGLLFLTLVAVNVGHLAAVRNENWGISEVRLLLVYVIPNLWVNGWFYLGDWRFFAIFMLLALGGLVGRRFGLERVVMLGYFVVFFGMGLLFYVGSYNYGADVRYSLMSYLLIAILGGLGVRRFFERLGIVASGDSARLIVAGALLFQFLWYLSGIRVTIQEVWVARADVRFVRVAVRNLLCNSFVLMYNLGMFHVWGVNAVQMSFIVINLTYLD